MKQVSWKSVLPSEVQAFINQIEEAKDKKQLTDSQYDIFMSLWQLISEMDEISRNNLESDADCTALHQYLCESGKQ